jgi:Uma2 family endonuclease
MAAPWDALLALESAPDTLAPGAAMTLEEWAALPEDERGELVDGRLTEEEVPDSVHEITVAWLILVLGNWLGDDGFVAGSELRTVVGSRGRKPDLSVFLPGTTAPPRRGPVRFPADVLVEVVSPSPQDERRDRVEKMAEYAAFGARWYWIVDPSLGSFEIFELDSERRYVKVVGVTSGPIEPVPGCPGLAIDVDRLWAKLARLAE